MGERLSDEIEAIRARWAPVLAEPRSGDGSADVASLLATLAAKDEEIAALRAEVDEYAEITRGFGATIEELGPANEQLRAELARLRARDERTARVIEAARPLTIYIRAEGGHGHRVHALAEALERALDDATDAAKTEAAHDLGAACGASVEERAAHRWSGWPGAWCLDCGIQDPREACLASGECPCGDQVAAPCKVQVPPCTEPGSRRHDPYAERSVEERAAESAATAARFRAMAEFDRRAWIRAADAKPGGPLALYLMGTDAVLMEVDRGTREECEETRGRLRRTVEAIVCTALDAEGPGVERAADSDPVAALSSWWSEQREARAIETPQDVIARLCTMQGQVAAHVFEFERPADCVCKESGLWPSPHMSAAEKAEMWRYDAAVLRWIEDRIAEAIARSQRHRARTQQRIGACLSMPPELAEAELRAISEAERADEEGER